MRPMSMEQTLTETQLRIWPRWRVVIQAIGLFVLALIPRAIALQHFVTADEAKWVYRSAQFLSAFLRGDFAATAVNLTPAVTTTWLGSAGLAAYYQRHHTDIGLSFVEWLATLPEFRVDLPILAAVRWPMVIFTALAIAIIYLLARRLWSDQIAFLGAALLALDLHTLALSRIIGHDAPVAIFMTLSVLALLIATRQPDLKTPWLILSGITAGLALLSKSPALFLIPFAGLVLWVNGPPSPPEGGGFGLPSQREGLGEGEIPQMPTKSDSLSSFFRRLGGALKRFLVWGLAAYIVFVIVWPAAWLAPVQQPYAIVENAFQSATRDNTASGEADTESSSNWLVPDLGLAYYLVNGAFKLSPIVLVGLIIAAIVALRKENRHPWRNGSRRTIVWLALFAILFTLFMTLGGKRSNRYILPIFPALSFIAAWGWMAQADKMTRWQGDKVTDEDLTPSPLHSFTLSPLLPHSTAPLLLLAAILVLPYAPYYFTYFNPLLGGPLTAPRLIKIGWGEGLDLAGRWLEAQPNPEATQAGSWYASSLAPFYDGDIADIGSSNLDYVVLYLKQLQDGQPHPAIADYFLALEPLHTVRLNGIDYAKIHPGPTAKLVLPDITAQTNIVAFRPHTEFVSIGETLTIDVIWASADKLPDSLPLISLRRDSDIFSEAKARGTDQVINPSPQLPVAHVWRYRLLIPDTLPSGDIELYAGDTKLGILRAFHTLPPDHFTLADVNFDDQVKLVGYAPKVAISGDTATVQLAFQANPKAWHDYTVFVHLITTDSERVTGHDAPPNPPTSQWHKAEVVLDTHTISLPFDLSPNANYKIRVGLYRADTGETLGEPYVLPVEIPVP